MYDCHGVRGCLVWLYSPCAAIDVDIVVLRCDPRHHLGTIARSRKPSACGTNYRGRKWPMPKNMRMRSCSLMTSSDSDCRHSSYIPLWRLSRIASTWSPIILRTASRGDRHGTIVTAATRMRWSLGSALRGGTLILLIYRSGGEVGAEYRDRSTGAWVARGAARHDTARAQGSGVPDRRSVPGRKLCIHSHGRHRLYCLGALGSAAAKAKADQRTSSVRSSAEPPY